MLRFIIVFILLFSDYTVFGQQDSVKADAVLINENVEYIIKADFDVTEKVKRTFLVYTEHGRSLARLVVDYDDFSKVKKAEIHVKNILLQDVTSKEDKIIYDESAISGYSFYDDERIKYSNVNYANYPFIIEYSYEKEYKEFYFQFNWVPQVSPAVRVDHAHLSVTYPEEINLRYKAFNLDRDPEIDLEKGNYTIRFTVENINAFEAEPFSPPLWEQIPHVLLVLNNFSYHGHPGSFESWATFGDWIYSLNEGRDQLPEDLQEKIHEITAGCADTTEMVKKIYQYVQDNTRYVSIQYGLGGQQPFPAEDVYENGYGDCKALSNYTVSMLKAAGIKANYTVVKAGYDDRPIQPDFPANQFNHVIVSVPMGEDTIWLECTSQTAPFNYLGHSTSNRYALAIDGHNSKLVKTPEYDYSTNKTSNTISVKLDEAGTAQIAFTLVATGVEYEEYGFLLVEDKSDQEKWILENIDIKSFDLESFEVLKDYSGLPKIIIKLNLSVGKYASVSGKRMFVPLKIYDPLEVIPDADEDRKNDIDLRYSYIEKDSITFQVPLGYAFEYIPEPITTTSKFGTFEMNVISDGHFITYTRKLIVNKGRFPAPDYPEFVNFYKTIQKADKQQVVLVKQ